MAALRPFNRWSCSVPRLAGRNTSTFFESPGDKTLWLVLQQYADVQEKGRTLFTGSLSEKNARHREFRNYVRQARTYWDAGMRTSGSAAALPLYYCFLQLAKAELLTLPIDIITGERIGHGLSYNPRGTSTIRSDRMTVQSGVFSALLEKRGASLPVGHRLPVLNMLSLIPEIGLEMSEIGPRRPVSGPCLHAVAFDESRAWPLIALLDGRIDQREPLSRQLFRHFEEIDAGGMSNWRTVFAMSARAAPSTLRIFQSKKTYSYTDADIRVVHSNAGMVVRNLLGAHVSDPIGQYCDFVISTSLIKSNPYVMPLGLVRYATVFYLSSLVRYKPSALDPVRNAAQAWLMDSFVREVPLNLLADAYTGITGEPVVFEPNAYRV